MPGLARLARDDARANYVTPGYPSITAQGWEALWTGAYGDVTGITGNIIPLLPKQAHALGDAYTKRLTAFFCLGSAPAPTGIPVALG